MNGGTERGGTVSGMDETFYAALGVDADADTDRIQAAYRERVKHTHPDVSDDADAAEAFKRLTEARDVLIDEAARERYDRVGHGTYIHEFLDSTVWTSAAAGDAHPGGHSSGEQDGATGGHESTEGATTGSETGTAGNYDRYRASDATWDDIEDDDPDERSGTSGRGTHVGEDPVGGSAGAWPSGRSDRTNSADSAGGTGAGRREQTRASGWQRTHTATGTYSPSGRDPSATGAQMSPSVSNVRSSLAEIGPWLVFHTVFLLSALVTVWLMLSLSPTVPTLLLGVALFGGTLLASSLHVMSRLYS